MDDCETLSPFRNFKQGVACFSPRVTHVGRSAKIAPFLFNVCRKFSRAFRLLLLMENCLRYKLLWVCVVFGLFMAETAATAMPEELQKTGREPLPRNAGKPDAVQAQSASDGVELTPLGAERSGNKEGTIPPWTGGITSPPAGYKKGSHHADPFSDDTVIFTIDAKNADRYRDKLSPGQIALLKKYRSFKMNIYPTRRSASLPQRIYDATIANKNTARLTKEGNSVDGAVIGIPFPEPKNGQEAIWNHFLRYRGDTVSIVSNHAAVTAGGLYTITKTKEEWYFVYHQRDASPGNIQNKIHYFLQEVTTPASLAGMIYLLHEPLDYTIERRNMWLYLPGQRRVERLAESEYDVSPGPTEGLRTVDQYDMYNGAIDLYDWKLLGKKELYVPYNAYKFHSGALNTADILKPGHINTDHARYELHRVWVVDAALKAGRKHLYPRRTFYLDEDSWQIVLVDIYDRQGNIWRVSEGHVINYYEAPIVWTVFQVHYDLKLGRYYFLEYEDGTYDFSIKRSQKDFNPAALRKLGKR